MSNDENKFQPIFQILHIKSAWFLLELAMALVTTIGMRFLQVCKVIASVIEIEKLDKILDNCINVLLCEPPYKVKVVTFDVEQAVFCQETLVLPMGSTPGWFCQILSRTIRRSENFWDQKRDQRQK